MGSINNHTGIVELHGRNEIEEFFKDEIKDTTRLHQYVDALLQQFPDGTVAGLPSEYLIDGVWITVPRKAREIVIYHT